MAPPKLPIKPMRPKPPKRPSHLPPGPTSYIRKGEGPEVLLLLITIVAIVLLWVVLR